MSEGVKTLSCGEYVFQLREIWKRIQKLQFHLKKNKKDFYSKLSLTKLLSKRRKFLNYLKEHSPEDYQLMIQEHTASKSKATTN